MDDADRGPTVTDEEILSVFANMDEGQLQLETVADELPTSAGALADRLDDLEERGLLDKNEDHPGAVWRLAPGVADDLTVPDEHIETTVEAQATKTTGVETPTREEETPVTPPPDPQTDPLEPVRQSPVDELEAFDPPGTLELEDRRRQVLLKVYLYLRDRGQASREDIESTVFPDASGGYDHPNEWWEQLVQPGLERLPDVIETEAGEAWQITADRGTPEE